MGQTSQTFNTPGIFTFTPPPGVTSIHVECWGGGGSSGNNTGGRGRGGGGGGAFTGGTINVTPGTPVTVLVGAGGLYNDNATASDDGGLSSVGIVIANGGTRGLIANNITINGGAGGLASVNPGGITSFISYAGGTGGSGYVAGQNGGGGGGGESASPTGPGNPGNNGTSGGTGGSGGNGNAGGGDGGRGSDNDGSPDSMDGIAIGGGGGGRADDYGTNTNGANGQVIITWTLPSGYCTGNAISVLNQINVAGSGNAVDALDGNGAHLNETGDQLTLDLTNGNLLTSGGSVDVIWRRVSNSNSSIKTEISGNGTTWISVTDYTDINPRNTWITQSIPLSINTRYIRFTSLNGWDLDIDAVAYSTPCSAACPPPVIYNVTGGGNYCTGGPGMAIGLSGSETGVAYQLYQGINPVGVAAAGTGASLNFGNQPTTGSYTVKATRLAGGCTSAMNGTADITIVSNPAQPLSIIGTNAPCIGLSQSYSVTNVPGTTFTWTFPAGWSQTSGGSTNSIIVTTGSTPGNIQVTPSNACGSGIPQILSVNPILSGLTQPGSITGVSAQCQNISGQVYSITAVAGATTYGWSVPAGWTITGGQGTTSIVVTTGFAGQNGNITVTAGNSCGTTTASVLAVIVNPAIAATPGAISGTATPCQGANGQVYSISAVADATNYTWTVPVGWAITSGQGTTSITVNPGTTGQNGNITVTAGNVCGTSMAKTFAVNVLTAPSKPGIISGPTPQCPGRTGQVYTIAAVPDATNYTWSVPAGWTITSGQGTTSITVTSGAVGQNGNILVTAGNACSTGTPQTLAVSVIPVPTPYISANYCAGGGYIRLTETGTGAGNTYAWSTGETTQAILINIAGKYTVTVTNAAGCSASASYDVATELVVNGDFSAGNTGFTHSTYIYVPNVAGNSELGPEGYYSVGNDPQAYHTNFWGRDHTTNSGNFMIVNGYPGAPQPVIWATTVATVPGVSYYFSAWALSLNSVGNYATLQFRVNNTLVGTTAPLPARPQNNNGPFNWIQFYGTWTAPAGVYSTAIEIVDSQTAANGNDFGLDDISFATLAPLPATIAPTSNASTFCPGQTLNLFANLKGGKPPYTYSWTGPGGFTSNTANPSIPNITIANAGIYTLTITDGYGCAPVTNSASPITVNIPPLCAITGPPILCPSSPGNIYSVPAGMTSYAWSITGNGTISGSTNGPSVNITSGAGNNSQITLSLAMTDAIGCSSNCQQILPVADNMPPTFILPILNSSYCVEYVSQALYNPGQENTSLDITYIRPDYFLFATGSTLLNLGSIADNCALASNPISWTIDFGNNGSVELSGTGQLSTLGSDIQFPLGTSRISYTVTDAMGNTTVKSADLIVVARPDISKNF